MANQKEPKQNKSSVLRATATGNTPNPNKVLEQVKMYANLLAIPVLLIVVWQLFASNGLLLEIILPSPLKVLSALRGMIDDGTLLLDLTTSGKRVLIGYFWGALLGITLGISSGISKLVERFVNPMVNIMRAIPMIAWIPLIVLWFGIGELSKRVIIGQMVFTPIFINTLQGVRNVSNDYIEVANVLELKYFKLLRKVIFPSALPSIFVGLRLSAGGAWMAVVAAEMLGGLSGLGYGLLTARDFLRSDKLLALMIVIGLVGLLCDRVLQLIASYALRWRKGFEGKR